MTGLTGARLERLIIYGYGDKWRPGRPIYWHPTGAGIDGTGLTRTAKRAMGAEMQDGRCGRCHTCLLPGTRHGQAPCGDHDHVSGILRGILCRRCNCSWTGWDNFTLTHLGWLWDLPQSTGPFVWVSSGVPAIRDVVDGLRPEDRQELARALAEMDLPLPRVLTHV